MMLTALVIRENKWEFVYCKCSRHHSLRGGVAFQLPFHFQHLRAPASPAHDSHSNAFVFVIKCCNSCVYLFIYYSFELLKEADLTRLIFLNISILDVALHFWKITSVNILFNFHFAPRMFLSSYFISKYTANHRVSFCSFIILFGLYIIHLLVWFKVLWARVVNSFCLL